jgi:hypothetical protein
METLPKPNIKIAKAVLPAPLLKALTWIFSQNIKDCMLVGGTALSGFYAGHRRSDDLDLFVKDENAFTQTILAFKSLIKTKAEIKESAHSKQYYKALCSMHGHQFTVDIVLDENIFTEGQSSLCGKKLAIANLPTIFMMKSATLVSRCSEKDLYDLLWLFQNLNDLKISDIITMGNKIDRGVKVDSLLYSVSSSRLRKEACHFSIQGNLDAGKIHAKITKFKKLLVQGFYDHANKNTDSNLKMIIKKMSYL